MNSLRYFVLILLSAFSSEWINTLAQVPKSDSSKSHQDFKVIEETKDYILKECDSGYYYSHGLPPKDDFVLDTTKIHKVNGVLKLPLDNGKEVVFRDTTKSPIEDKTIYNYDGYNKKLNIYMLEFSGYEQWQMLLIDKSNGSKDTMVGKLFSSPSCLFYVHDLFCVHYDGLINVDDHPWSLKLLNLKTKKVNIIGLNNEMPFYIKWIDDKSFVFYTVYRNNKKYYLVQIKQ